MPAQVPMFQEVFRQLSAGAGPAKLRQSSLTRLALLITGMCAAQTCVLSKVAAQLWALGLTRATQKESIERRLRRTLNDPALDAETCYEPVLAQVLDWAAVLRGSTRVVLIVDESTKEDEIHLLRLSLAYWGGCLPLVSLVWQQGTRLPAGDYWAKVDQVLARVAAVLPPGLEVLVVADRAYDVPAFVDRLAAYDWHWIVRCKANSSMRFLDHQRREGSLRDVVRQRVRAPGMRWKARGQVFKDAGWRAASVVALWAPGTKERVVVLTDLPPKWEVVQPYGWRFWTEPGFRNDKARGWQWEDCQVQGVAHHERLLLAMAWASLVTLCVGVQEAKTRVARLGTRRAQRRGGTTRVGKPQHARESVFTMGLRCIQRWLHQPLVAGMQWLLVELDALSWAYRWYQAQSYRYIFQTVRP